MPNVNVYVSEDEYTRLVFFARKNGLRASQLARKILAEWLKEKEGEEE
jgi:hypothetical protein